ncbi:MAG: peptide chain release factor [Chthoniobacter sp.]|nr:peptide chain release factor [Chthoniobacter sp.]
MRRRCARLGVREEDFAESFARSSGPGGQHVNKVSTAVTLRHVPTGIAVTVQDTRSQSMNRQLARERLLELLERQQRERRQMARALREKKRRQNAKRPRAVKKRMLENKRHRGQTKKLRGKIGDE